MVTVLIRVMVDVTTFHHFETKLRRDPAKWTNALRAVSAVVEVCALVLGFVFHDDFDHDLGQNQKLTIRPFSGTCLRRR